MKKSWKAVACAAALSLAASNCIYAEEAATTAEAVETVAELETAAPDINYFALKDLTDLFDQGKLNNLELAKTLLGDKEGYTLTEDDEKKGTFISIPVESEEKEVINIALYYKKEDAEAAKLVTDLLSQVQGSYSLQEGSYLNAVDIEYPGRTLDDLKTLAAKMAANEGYADAAPEGVTDPVSNETSYTWTIHADEKNIKYRKLLNVLQEQTAENQETVYENLLVTDHGSEKYTLTVDMMDGLFYQSLLADWETENPELATEEVETEEPTTAEATTEEPTTPEATTEEPTTAEATTEEPTTPEATTEEPTTPEVTTEEPTTPEATTEAPTTAAPTTEAPTTAAPTTEAPTTAAPTTEAPTTAAPTTEAPTTAAPTTAVPTTVPAVTTVNSLTPAQSRADALTHGLSYLLKGMAQYGMEENLHLTFDIDENEKIEMQDLYAQAQESIRAGLGSLTAGTEQFIPAGRVLDDGDVHYMYWYRPQTKDVIAVSMQLVEETEKAQEESPTVVPVEEKKTRKLLVHLIREDLPEDVFAAATLQKEDGQEQDESTVPYDTESALLKELEGQIYFVTTEESGTANEKNVYTILLPNSDKFAYAQVEASSMLWMQSFLRDTKRGEAPVDKVITASRLYGKDYAETAAQREELAKSVGTLLNVEFETRQNGYLTEYVYTETVDDTADSAVKDTAFYKANFDGTAEGYTVKISSDPNHAAANLIEINEYPQAVQRVLSTWDVSDPETVQ